MNGKVFVLPLLLAVTLVFTACGGEGTPPGAGGATAVNGGALSVQLTTPPPATMIAGQQMGVVATVNNDKNSAGVTWSCAPANACGVFTGGNPAGQTLSGIDILFTAPVAAANGPITPFLAYTVTITATSNADSSQSASATITVGQQYAFVLNGGYGGWGMAGSVTLDGQGNILSGEADSEAPGFIGHFAVTPSSVTNSASFYSVDATGHGIMSLDFSGPGFASDVQTHGITATSNSHLVLAEEDQFNGWSYGDGGSMDLQTAGPNFSGAQVLGGYSFTFSGYSGAMGENTSWAGIFTADGTATATTPGNITGGIFDENAGNNGGGCGYNSAPTGNPAPNNCTPVNAAGLSFTGTYTAPDASGRGTLILSATPDTIKACGANPTAACTQTQYAYYLVTPEVLRLAVMNNNGDGATSGSAFGQGSLATAANDTNAALSGGFVFSYFGFGDNNNGGDVGVAAGQFATATDGSGDIISGVMDLNVADGGAPASTIVTPDIPLANPSAIAISGSPRGTLTTPSGQIYNIYLTDPTLNLLDPNNPSGAGGALLLEANNTSATTPYGNAIGVMIPQDAAAAAFAGSYATLLFQESNDSGSCCDNDSGFTGDFTVSTTTPGTFSGEGDFQGTGGNAEGQCCETLVTGPLTGTFAADLTPGHQGRFIGTILTTPCYPFYVPDPTSPTPCGTVFSGNGILEPSAGAQVSFYLANGSQGFIVETDTTAPVFGVLEAQGAISISAAAAKRARAQQQHSHPKNLLQTTGEQHGRFSGPAGSGHE
jgi:hypothetical protein